MIQWVRTRRLLWLVLVLAGALVSGVIGRAREVTLPVLFGSGSATTPLVTFVPVLWGACVAHCFAPRTLVLEARPSRRFLVLDAVMFGGVSVVAAIAFGRLVTVAGPTLHGCGSMLLASGLALCVLARGGVGPAVFALSGLALTTSMYGVSAPGARYVRVFASDGDPVWSLVIGTAASIGALWIMGTHRVRTRLGADEAGE